jgi:hypothetical protein
MNHRCNWYCWLRCLIGRNSYIRAGGTRWCECCENRKAQNH